MSDERLVGRRHQDCSQNLKTPNSSTLVADSFDHPKIHGNNIFPTKHNCHQTTLSVLLQDFSLATHLFAFSFIFCCKSSLMPQPYQSASVPSWLLLLLPVVLSVLQCSVPTTTAFSMTPQRVRHMVRIISPTSTVRKMTSEEESPMQKRKRKRKAEVEASATNKPLIQLQPRDDKPVSMEIMDIRQAVGGFSTPQPKGLASSSTTQPSTRTTGSSTSSSLSSSSSSTSASSKSSSMNDSLQQLLEDAKQMQQLEEPVEEESKVKAAIRNALSTLVTADFFVVCVFLLWFLVGIFSSSVLKDDTIQIAFNSKCTWTCYLDRKQTKTYILFGCKMKKQATFKPLCSLPWVY